MDFRSIDRGRCARCGIGTPWELGVCLTCWSEIEEDPTAENTACGACGCRLGEGGRNCSECEKKPAVGVFGDEPTAGRNMGPLSRYRKA